MFEVGLIDNVHSDLARLRGFYGHMAVGHREVRAFYGTALLYFY